MDLVKEIDDIIENQFSHKVREKGIKMSLINNSIEDHWWINLDKQRLNQILINVIDNAIKFSKKDDVINILIRDYNDFDLNLNQTELDGTKDNTYSYRAVEKEEKNQVYIGVSDTGKGISSKVMPKLFEKFVTDSDFGTGLGLFITKKLVDAHGGRIWAFNNNDGIGSTFVFSLPR